MDKCVYFALFLTFCSQIMTFIDFRNPHVRFQIIGICKVIVNLILPFINNFVLFNRQIIAIENFVELVYYIKKGFILNQQMTLLIYFSPLIVEIGRFN